MSKKLENLSIRLEILKKEYEIEKLLRKLRKIREFNRQSRAILRLQRNKNTLFNPAQLAETCYSDNSASELESNSNKQTPENTLSIDIQSDNLIWDNIPPTSILERILTTAPLNKINRQLYHSH